MSHTLKQPVFTELEIKKSRFLAWVEPVAGREAAQSRIAELRARYPDARHVCFAFYAGGDSGMSDDGEPAGTAGKPIFNVLHHKSLANVLAVVVRYFGGVKLGAGGLARAYGGAVSQAMELADLVPLERQMSLRLTLPFALESDARRLIDRYRLALYDVGYDQGVTLALIVPESQLAPFRADFQALSPGNPALRDRLAD